MFLSSFLSLIVHQKWTNSTQLSFWAEFSPRLNEYPQRQFSLRKISQTIKQQMHLPKFANFFFWRISGKFDIITFAQRCKTTNCHYCWKRIGNVFLVVWSTASFASLIIHTTGLEDSPSERRISRVVSRDFWWPLLLDCKTVRIFAYSSTREQSNKRSGKSGTRLKTESETGERR